MVLRVASLPRPGSVDVELLDINGKHSVLTLHKCTSHAFLNLGFGSR